MQSEKLKIQRVCCHVCLQWDAYLAVCSECHKVQGYRIFLRLNKKQTKGIFTESLKHSDKI